MNDTKMLEAALFGLDESELDELISDIELPESRRAGRSIAEKLMRKEKMTMTGKTRKRTAAIALGAAAVLACSAAAGAYYYYDHTHQKENVSAFYSDSDTADKLESKGLLDDEQLEFDHLVISKDTKVICDGGVAMYAISLIPVDEQGNEIVGNGKLEMNIDIDVEAYDENGNNMFTGGGTSFNYNDEYLGLLSERDFLKYNESIPVKVKVSDRRTGDELAKLDYVFEKNVDSVEFKDENGRRILLSEIALLGFDGVDVFWGFDGYAEKPGDSPLLTFIYKNGEQKELTHSDISGAGGSGIAEEGYISSNCCFDGFIDPEEIEAILIDGGRFEIAE